MLHDYVILKLCTQYFLSKACHSGLLMAIHFGVALSRLGSMFRYLRNVILEFVGHAKTLTLNQMNILCVILLRTWSTLKTAVLFLPI